MSRLQAPTIAAQGRADKGIPTDALTYPEKEILMKRAIPVLALPLILLSLGGTAFAGVDKHCETYRSKYWTDLGEIPARTYFPVRVQQAVVPTFFNGMTWIGISQPADSDNKFKGLVKFRRSCYDVRGQRFFRETAKDKPGVMTDPNDPTRSVRGYSFSLPFHVGLDFNEYCLDEIWVKKPGQMAVGKQSYVDRFEADGYDCGKNRMAREER